jgi:GNAT superfamily N-acetyltransferase
MDFSIRQAVAADATGIAEVLRSIDWLARFRDQTLEGTTQQVYEMLLVCFRDDSHAIYVAEEGGKGLILGYGVVHWLPYPVLAGVEGFVSDLFVASDWRGSGVGTALLARIKEEAIERGCCRLSLLNGRGREAYERGFYRKSGWEERDAMANFVLRIPNPPRE